MNDAKKIDILNFILIWVTLIAAFNFPFELFLFSYAVLGPLHYLTEINWLEKKNYFLKGSVEKRTYLVTVVVALVLITSFFLIGEFGKWDMTKPFQDLIIESRASEQLKSIAQWSDSAFFICLIVALVLLLIESWVNRLLIIIISAVCTLFFYKFPFFAIFFGGFLPTIIHVFVFTVLFMWAGSKKAKSGWGYVNVISMFLVIVVIVNKEIIIDANSVDISVINTYAASNFHQTNYAINKLLGFSKDTNWNYLSVSVWKIQIFIAFAYTYHYLNWFSKTSLIQWHQVNKKKMAAAVGIWIVSLILYYTNYRLGFAVLYVFAMLHVFLEFPLNINSMIILFRSSETGENKNRKKQSKILKRLYS